MFGSEDIFSCSYSLIGASRRVFLIKVKKIPKSP